LAACGGELDEARSNQLGGRDDLHVAELPHVVVPPAEGTPADEDIGGALDQPFPADYPLAVVAVAAGLDVRLVHRRTSLLDLQEQRVSPAAALQEHQIDPHAPRPPPPPPGGPRAPTEKRGRGARRSSARVSR